MHQIITPGGVRQPVRASVRSSIETELRHLPSRDLESLRRGLRRQLAELPVGSPASRLVGRQLRLARSELRRRQDQRGAAVSNRHGCWSSANSSSDSASASGTLGSSAASVHASRRFRRSRRA
jgi:hypothetical protein